MKSLIFREYDIRGIFEKELNEEVVKKIGYYFALEILSKNKNAKYISIGYDARVHSVNLMNWLVSGINFAGLKALNMGLVPTPVCYFSNYIDFDDISATSSIMITGSHNPPEYNGFKITLDKQPFFADMIYSLGDRILNSTLDIPDDFTSIKINAKEKYIDFIVDHFKDLKLDDSEYIFDCGNGVASVVLEEILEKLNIKSKLLFAKPDGTFPNHHPDPSEEENLIDLKNKITNSSAKYGFAYDGDADRVAFLSRKYNFKGDTLAIFLSKFIPNPLVIGEVKCSQIMYDQINSFGKSVMYKTGHSNLKVKIKELNASFAAEVSGHIFFNDRYFGFDDAIYATFRILELVQNKFDFDKEYESLPQLFVTDEEKISVLEEEKFLLMDKLKTALNNTSSPFPKIKDIITIDGVRVIFENGWGLIRASNTTPMLVTRFEANSKEDLELYKISMLDLLESLK